MKTWRSFFMTLALSVVVLGTGCASEALPAAETEEAPLIMEETEPSETAGESKGMTLEVTEKPGDGLPLHKGPSREEETEAPSENEMPESEVSVPQSKDDSAPDPAPAAAEKTQAPVSVAEPAPVPETEATRQAVTETAAPVVTEAAIPAQETVPQAKETEISMTETSPEETCAVTETTPLPQEETVPEEVPESTVPSQAPETTGAPVTEGETETIPAGDPDYVYRTDVFTFVVPEPWRGIVTIKPFDSPKPGFAIWCGEFYIGGVIELFSGPGGYNTDGRGYADCIKLNGQYAVDVTAVNYGFMVDHPGYFTSAGTVSYEQMKSADFRQALYCETGHYVNVDDYYADGREYSPELTEEEMHPLSVQVEAYLPGLLAGAVHEADWQP